MCSVLDQFLFSLFSNNIYIQGIRVVLVQVQFKYSYEHNSIKNISLNIVNLYRLLEATRI